MSETNVARGYALRHTVTVADLDIIHGYLSTQTYWSPGVPRPTVERAFAHSLPFLWDAADSGELCAFARVITDTATFAYLADVFVVPKRRGQGLGKRVVTDILAYPDLQNLRRFLLFTLDAHGLYTPFGFEPLAHPERVLQRFTPTGTY